MMKILLFFHPLSFDRHRNAKLCVPQMIRDHLRAVLHIKKKTFGRHEPRSGQEVFNQLATLTDLICIRTSFPEIRQPMADAWQ
jgi:hypothetical protein